MEKYLL